MFVGMKTRLIFPVAALVAILMPVEVLAAQQPTVEISYHGIQGGVRVSDPRPNPKVWTFLVVRGWSGWFGDNLDAYWRQAEALQKRYPGANVVVVRWLVKPPYPGTVPFGPLLVAQVVIGKQKVANYYWSAVAAKQIAEAIVHWMDEKGIEPSKTMVCGHSLGGQIAAFVGTECKRIFKAPIHTILATDPAGPLFEDKAPADRLDASDAQHVVVVHTTVVLGDERPIGTADIYVVFPSDKDGDFIWRHQQARELVTECLQGSNPKAQAQRFLKPVLFQTLKLASE